MRILYGRGPGPPDEWGEPELRRFRQSDEGLEVEFEGVSKVTVREKGVRWIDLMDNSKRRRWNKRPPGHRTGEMLSELLDELEEECHPDSDVERKFFSLFGGLSMHEAFMSPSAAGPALIPNVWVNWYPQESKRDRLKEPYIADFAIKDPDIEGGDLTLIEIDGPSHYAEYDETRQEYTFSETRYASHLRDDRFLRRIAPKVIRIGRSEIRSVENGPEGELYHFYHLWKQIFDSNAWIGRFEDIDHLS